MTLLDTLASKKPSPHLELERKEKAALLKKGLDLLSPELGKQ